MIEACSRVSMMKLAPYRAGNDGAREAPEPVGLHRIVDPEFVLVQVDHQLECAAGKDALAPMRRGIAQRPEGVDEMRKRRRGMVGKKQHVLGWQSIVGGRRR